MPPSARTHADERYMLRRATACESIPAVKRSERRFWPLGWLGVLLCGVAVLVLAIMLVGNHRATSGPSVRLADGPHHVVLPADKTYGIYINDANNSGYTESCTAVDAQGSNIAMRDPSWSISGSDTETLDIVYNTASGNLTINCSVPGEIITTRPVPNYCALLIGALAAGAMAVVGIILIVTRFTRARSVGMPLPHDGSQRQVSRG
jgi:hypothetical protein